MELAVRHYTTGAAFNPSLPHFRTSAALSELLAGGGLCAVCSSDLRVLDATHDISLTQKMADRVGTRPGRDCTLRLSNSEDEPPLNYDDLARMLIPTIEAMEDGRSPPHSPATATQCVLVTAVYPRFGVLHRSLKLMSLVRHRDGRAPVMLAVQSMSAITPL